MFSVLLQICIFASSNVHQKMFVLIIWTRRKQERSTLFCFANGETQFCAHETHEAVAMCDLTCGLPTLVELK